MFHGEMMICYECKTQKQSDPNVESGWTAIETTDPAFHKYPMVLYFCPKCWVKIVNTLAKVNGDGKDVHTH